MHSQKTMSAIIFLLCFFTMMSIQYPPVSATRSMMMGGNFTFCYENLPLCQERLQKEVYGVDPTTDKGFFRPPDYVDHSQSSAYTQFGLPGPGAGTRVGNVQWKNNLTALTWTISERNLTLNSTIFWTLNTQYRAPANYPPPPYINITTAAASKRDKLPNGPGQPTDASTPWGLHPVNPSAIASETLLLYHNGHETTFCQSNFDGVVDYYNELGFDVMELYMPLIGCNTAPAKYGNPPPHSHWWFKQWEEKGYHTMKFFVEPVAQVVHYAKSTLGYKSVVLIGLSGGGWTTTVAGAIINDLDLTIPVAGSVPKWRSPLLPAMWVPDLPEGRNPLAQPGNPFIPPPVEGAGGDYEQEQHRPIYSDSVAKGGIGYAELYALATFYKHRRQLQILHTYDSCCFRAEGLLQNISTYGKTIRQLVDHSSTTTSWRFQTVVTEGNFHEVNFQDKIIIGTVLDRFRACVRKKTTTKSSALRYDDECIERLFEGRFPFDVLEEEK